MLHYNTKLQQQFNVNNIHVYLEMYIREGASRGVQYHENVQ